MTRDGSLIDFGFFEFPVGDNNPPTHDRKNINAQGDLSYLRQIAEAFVFKNAERGVRIADPFCGTGTCINLLGNFWRTQNRSITVYANEMDFMRYRTAQKLWYKDVPDNIVRGSAHDLWYKPRSMAVTWLNPPYQKDSTSGERTEITAMLRSDMTMLGGYTLLAVYAHQLTDNAHGLTFLDRIWYSHDDVKIWRVPGKHLGAYTQVLVVCRAAQRHDRGTQANAMYNDLRAKRLVDETWGFLSPVTAMPQGLYELDCSKQIADLPKSPFVWSQKVETVDEQLRLWGDNSPFKSPGKLAAHLSTVIPDGIVRPAMALRGRQILAMLANGAFDGMRVTTEKGAAYVRAVNRQMDSEPRVEVKKNEEGDTVGKVTKFYRQVKTEIVLLYETGEIVYLSANEEFDKFLDDHMDDFERHAGEKFVPIYNFDFVGGTKENKYRDGLLYPFFQELRVGGKSLLMAQAHLIAGTVINAVQSGRGFPIVWAEQGYGKTVMACATLHILWRLSQIKWGIHFDADSPVGKALANPEWKAKCDAFLKKYGNKLMKKGMFSLIVAPPHIINQTEKKKKKDEDEDGGDESKWMREAKDTLGWAHIALIKNVDDMAKFAGNVRGDAQRKLPGKPEDLHIALISREMLKGGEGWEPAYIERTMMSRDSETGKPKSVRVLAHPDTGVILGTQQGQFFVPLRKADVEKATWWYSDGECRKDPRDKHTHRMPKRPEGLRLRMKDGELVRGIPRKDKEGNLLPGHPEFMGAKKFGMPYGGTRQIGHHDDESKRVPYWRALPAWQFKREHTGLTKDPLDTLPIQQRMRDDLAAHFNLRGIDVDKRDNETYQQRMIIRSKYATEDVPAPLSSTAKSTVQKRREEIVENFRLFPFPEYFLPPDWQNRSGKEAVSTRRIKKNAKMPIGEFIRQRYRDMLYTACFDELHEYAGKSIQGEMLSIVSSFSKIVIGYTGTFFKGKASDAWRMAHVFNPLAHKLYPLGDKGSLDAFIDDMGKWEIRESRSSAFEDRESNYRNTTTKKNDVRTTKTEKPGITPLMLNLFIGQFLIGHMLDHVSSLPGYAEKVFRVDMDEDVAERYANHIMPPVDSPPPQPQNGSAMEKELKDKGFSDGFAKAFGSLANGNGHAPAIAENVLMAKEDRSLTIRSYVNSCLIDGDTSVLASFYQAAMTLPDVPFRPYDFQHFPITEDGDGYRTKGKPKVISLSGYGEDRVYAKESAILDFIAEQLAQDRGVGLYIVNTGEDRDVQARYERLLKQRFPNLPASDLLYSLRSSVATTKREQLIGGLKVNVLLTQPKLVATGVNLYRYPTLIWAQIPNELVVLEQGSRRSWRLGQTVDCITAWFVYNNTYQYQGILNMKAKANAAAFLHGRRGATFRGFLESGEDEASMEAQMAEAMLGKRKGTFSVAEDLFMTIEGKRLIEDEDDTFAPALPTLPPPIATLLPVNGRQEGKLLRLLDDDPEEMLNALPELKPKPTPKEIKGHVVKAQADSKIVQLSFGWDD